MKQDLVNFLKKQKKYLLTIFLTINILFAVSKIFISEKTYDNHEERFAYQQAKILNTYMSEYRHYYQAIFVDGRLELNDKTLPVLPAYSSTIIGKNFSNNNDFKISVKTVSDNARNQLNNADALELEAIEKYKNNPDLKETFKKIEKRDGDYYLYTSVLKIKESCLVCHSSRDSAPAFIAKKYSGAFGYKLNDVRGVVSVKIPTKHIGEFFNIQKKISLAFDFIAFILLSGLLFVTYRILNNYNRELEKDINIKTNDIQMALNELRDNKKELIKSVSTDALTGLDNRAKFIVDLENRKNPSLAIFDIDGFSDINDFYGHEMGDYILKELGKNIKLLVYKKAFIYRYASDKFVLLADDVDRNYFLSLVESILHEADIYVYSFEDLKASIKLSVAVSFESKEYIIQSADMILKELKKRNLNFLIYDKTLGIEDEIKNNIVWNKKVKDALREDRIINYYQPIYNNRTKKIEKYESLVRMVDVDGTIISPYKFLDIAKKSKQYTSITKKVIENTFEKFKDVDVEFSINITMEDISNIEINSLLDFRMSDKRFNSRVVYEIVESEGLEGVDNVYEFIRKAKHNSCRIAIDDFGTGYSNFEYLIKLHPDYIKIDGSMIKNIIINQDSEEVVKIIIDFARKQNLKTIAEFVSSKEIHDKVVELGIDYSQGYYIGEPKSELVGDIDI
ncbi:MAG: EAL domain-containing protein [Sulfurimonas sp.]|nr:EAL domain-containing protein [Sulfurimonas sp.]